ncbi:MAG: hypothetical protein FWB99_10935 [Treponema sp.]|nr:hypothetical protein [Treponema sp.]
MPRILLKSGRHQGRQACRHYKQVRLFMLTNYGPDMEIALKKAVFFEKK